MVCTVRRFTSALKVSAVQFSGAFLICAIAFVAVVFPQAGSAQTKLGTVSVGSSASASVTVTLVNAATLGTISVLTMGSPSLDFTDAGSGSCTVGHSYTANSTCTVEVNFAPKYSGARYGAVVLGDSNQNTIATGYLQGTGDAPQVVYFPGTVNMLASGFLSPVAIAVDGAGNLYVSDSGTANTKGAVYKETLSGGSYSQTSIGVATTGPQGVAVDGAGNVYVADIGCTFKNCFPPNPDCIPNFNGAYLCKETLQPTGAYVESGILYKTSANGPYGMPKQLTVDGSGNLYIADVSGTLFPELLQPDGSYVTGVTFAIGNLTPIEGVSVDQSGNIFVTSMSTTEFQNPNYSFGQAELLTLSGNTYTAAFASGPSLGFPDGIAVSNNGGIYISNFPNGPPQYGVGPGIYLWEPSTNSYIDYLVSGGFNSPYGIANDGGGHLYIADSGGATVSGPAPAIYKVDIADPPTLSFASTPEGASSGDPQSVTILNQGTSALTISAITYPKDFSPGTSISTVCTTSTPLSPGQSCVVPILFTPVTPLNGKTTLVLTESVGITTNTLNATATAQAIAVTGTETSPLTATPVIMPPAGNYNAVQSVTITDATPGSAIYYTTDGSQPTQSSTPYTGAISVSQSETISAIAVANGYASSVVGSALYNIALADFSVSATPAAVNISSTQSGQVTVSILPANNFSSAVSFACSGLPAGASCSFSPQTVTPSGGVASTTVTVSTTAAAGAVRSKLMLLLPVAMLGLCWLGGTRRRRLTSVAVICVGFSLVGCGGGGSSTPPPPITSTVTVTATSGALQHATTFMVTEPGAR